jgi:hypothetical protein
MVSIEQYCLYAQAKTSLMGLQTNRTESKSRVLINPQRSVSVARIVTEKDPILSTEYVV